jgi:hypothetical protein
LFFFSFNPVAVEKEISQKKQNQTSETKSTNQGSETTTQQKSTAEGEGSSQTENTTEANGHKPNNKIQGKEGAIPIPGRQLSCYSFTLYFLTIPLLMMECVLQFPISHSMLMYSLDVNLENLMKQ